MTSVLDIKIHQDLSPDGTYKCDLYDHKVALEKAVATYTRIMRDKAVAEEENQLNAAWRRKRQRVLLGDDSLKGHDPVTCHAEGCKEKVTDQNCGAYKIKEHTHYQMVMVWAWCFNCVRALAD